MNTMVEPSPLSTEEMGELRAAKETLEHPSFAIRIANLAGTPLEKGFARLPEGWSRKVDDSVDLALRKTLRLAITSLDPDRSRPPANHLHRILAGTTGAVGGMLGLVALPFELPLSTTIIFRSIADIARSEHHSLREARTRLDCLEVFALGNRKLPGSPSQENQYWLVRAAHSHLLGQAARIIASQSLAGETAPVLVHLISRIAARYGTIVSQQIAAKALPLAGAATGSGINLLFMHHFQRLARAHFVIRRLEGRHGSGTVQEAYRSIPLPITSREIRRQPARNI